MKLKLNSVCVNVHTYLKVSLQKLP